MLGGVTVVDPRTGRFFDDNRPYLDRIDWLTVEDRKKIFEDNARLVYPRLGPILEERRRQKTAGV
jgi:4-oxalmesaconate hydratase